MSVRGRWLLAVAVLAAVGIVGGVAVGGWRWYAGRGPQLGADVPVMEQAVTDVLAAVGNEAAVALNGMVRSRTCSAGVGRDGGRYTFTAELYVDAGAEDGLITRIGQRLPAGYQARREAAAGGTAAPLSATAGGVRVSVRQLGDGWLVVSAATGCTRGPTQPADASPAAGDPAIAAITSLLTQVGTRPASLSAVSLGCINTVAAVSAPADSSRLAQRLAPPAGARVLTGATSNRLVWRSDAVSVALAPSDDSTTVNIRHTTTC